VQYPSKMVDELKVSITSYPEWKNVLKHNLSWKIAGDRAWDMTAAGLGL